MKPSDHGLTGRGADLFVVLTEEFDFAAHEVPTLVELCRTASLLERLEEEMRRADLIVMGSQRQPVGNPILTELARHRGMLIRLFAALDLPVPGDDDDDGPAYTKASSIRASRAARARWAKERRDAEAS